MIYWYCKVQITYSKKLSESVFWIITIVITQSSRQVVDGSANAMGIILGSYTWKKNNVLHDILHKWWRNATQGSLQLIDQQMMSW